MTFVLFGTDGCHLCDIAAQLVVVAAEGIEAVSYTHLTLPTTPYV